MIEIENLPLPLRGKGIEDKLIKICEDNDVVFFAIFGSFARGEQGRRSDIDIAVEFDRNKRKSLLDLVHLEYELKRVFKRNVDLGIFSSISPYMIDDVKKRCGLSMKKDRACLQHILDAIFDIEKFVEGITQEEFYRNKEKQYAVLRALEIVGEATKNLSKELRTRYREIPLEGHRGHEGQINP